MAEDFLPRFAEQLRKEYSGALETSVTIDENKFHENWSQIVKSIESQNSKTANFLSDSIIESYNNNKLVIKINNVSRQPQSFRNALSITRSGSSEYHCCW